MNCAIIGCPDYADNVWLFTNIPVEEMVIYSPSSEYYMHKVEITDSDLYAEIITRFPILSSAIVFLDLNKFMSCYNKSEKTPEAMKLSIIEENIVFTCNELSVVCGSLLPEFTATLYSSLFERSVIKTENPYIQKLS
ncbi:MAG: hypothetical protein PHR06_15780, partial [Candidatus Cloacimonetes bacterium]|nr:hypothetical protein [Candidatus Cloacimonadota bacterium]